jgi:hypothetical protein
MSYPENESSHARKMPVHQRLYLIGACILIAGFVCGALIYFNAADTADDSMAYEGSDASAYAVMPKESRQYNFQLERIGGKSAVLAAELDDWFSSLWHGKRLGYTVVTVSTVVAFACFLFARLLFLHADVGDVDRND